MREVSDDPDVRLWKEPRENRGRRLDLESRHLSTELDVVVRDVHRVELVAKRLTEDRRGVEELRDRDVLQEPRARRFHLVSDVFLVRSDGDIDGTRDCACRE